MNFLEKHFVPIAARIGSQRHLVAVRDGFVSIMPIIILGSLATLINALPIKIYQSTMNSLFHGENWKNFGGSLWTASFAIMSILVAFTIAYHLAKSYESDSLSAGIVSLASLISITTLVADGAGLPLVWMGSQGLFIAIIVALISTEIFVKLTNNDKLIVKMPEGVPPAVSKSFAALLPTIITVSLFGIFKFIVNVDLHLVLFNSIQKPLSGLANTIWSAMFIAFLNHLLWFFGLHGSNILEPLMQTVYLPALDANATAFAAGQTLPNIVTKPFFDAFVYIGGSGTTLSLLFAIYIVGKTKHLKSLSNLSIAPGFFNINEPVIFGLPIVLNPVLFIPFLFIPLILTVFSYLVTSAGLVPKTFVMMPWTAPPILGGYIATGGSIAGSILQIINLAIATIIYIPFVMISEKLEINSSNQEKQKIAK